ncbi:unnamed protein product [Mytilus coruscus]|uniref:Uncharacterized protein n=1 Tax=Mytilus coruscus TaxID=42192 RepID=A0A6J8ERB4_MYTCO|nr:unnamed protein product [Mytilus coruscus]
MENEPVLRLDRQKDISSNHEEIQESRGKAQDTVQFQSTDTNHDLEKCFKNLEVVEEESTENNHDLREESQNLHAHEDNDQELGATGYSEQPEEPDDLPKMLTEKVDTDGMFNTCTIDTILTIMAVLQLKIGQIHDFFKNSKHRIYKRIAAHKEAIKPRVPNGEVEIIPSDYRPKDAEEVPHCIPDQMQENPCKFFKERLKYYLNFFFIHNNSSNGRTAYCQNCRCERKITYEVEGSDGNPAPLFIVMLPINGTTESGNVIWEDVVKGISPLCCFKYEYVVGAVIVFIANPFGSETSSNCSDSLGSETSSNCSDSQEEHKPGLIADTDEESIGHYIGHVYIVNPESGEITKKYRYCNSKGIKEVREFENKGDCVTFLLFRTK